MPRIASVYRNDPDRVPFDFTEIVASFAPRAFLACAARRCHADHPYVFHAGGQEYRVSYLPAESDTGMFGGNSNWRGPIWMPVNALIIRALLQYYAYYGNFTVECPSGSGRQMNLYQVAEEIARRLASIFLRDKDGHRPVYGGTRKFQEDPYWRDCVLFYEYFHGDNGAGLEPATKPAGPALSPGCCTCSPRSRPSSFWKGASEPRSTRMLGTSLPCRRAVGDLPPETTHHMSMHHEHTALSFAVSNQHPRLANRVVAGSRPAGDTG
jgi:hypothetical protein